jgi:hypothetical protein
VPTLATLLDATLVVWQIQLLKATGALLVPSLLSKDLSVATSGLGGRPQPPGRLVVELRVHRAPVLGALSSSGIHRLRVSHLLLSLLVEEVLARCLADISFELFVLGLLTLLSGLL